MQRLAWFSQRARRRRARRPPSSRAGAAAPGRRVGSLAAVLEEALRCQPSISPCRRHDRLVDVGAGLLGRRDGAQHPLVVARHDLHELRHAGTASRTGCGRPPPSRSRRGGGRWRRPATSVSRSSSGVEVDHLGVEAARRRCRRGRTRRRCRRTCRRRSCGRSGRGSTTWPPVMYSQPWSPTPSTTAVAPELRTRTARRPGRAGTPRRWWRRTGCTLPAMMLSSATKSAGASSRRAHDEPAAGQALADVVVGVAVAAAA